jgi:hypothetical protein
MLKAVFCSEVSNGFVALGEILHLNA